MLIVHFYAYVTLLSFEFFGVSSFFEEWDFEFFPAEGFPSESFARV